ncbi:MAG TPA: tetratricopeptide repeat protein, partial [Abditibacteriaceae bacterium]
PRPTRSTVITRAVAAIVLLGAASFLAVAFDETPTRNITLESSPTAHLTEPVADTAAPPDSFALNPFNSLLGQPALGNPASGNPPTGTTKQGQKPAPPKAARVDPVAVAFQQAVALQKAGKTPEAIAAYAQVLKLKPDVLPAHLNLAILYLQTQQAAPAIVHLRAAQRLDPKNPAIPFQLAQTLLQLRRTREALEPLRTAVRLSPRNPAGYTLLAQVYGELRRPAESYAAWAKVSDLAPKDAGAAFTAGVMAFEQLKKLPEAERYLRRAVSLEKRDPRGPLYLGRILAARGKLPEAERVFVDAAKRFPKIVEMNTTRADIRWARGNKSGSINALRAATQAISPTQDGGVPAGRLHLALGRQLGQAKRWPEAAASLRRAAQLLPREPDVHGMLAEAHLRTGNRNGAINELRRTLALDAKRSAARRTLAQVLTDAKQYRAARTEYVRYLEQQPRDVGALVQLAALEEELGQPVRALGVWQRASKLLAENPLPHLQSARLLRKSGRDAEALKKYRYVLQIAPGDPNALLGAAGLEEKAGQNARALVHWRSLVAARPDYPPAYEPLMRVAQKMNQLPATLNFLKPILAKNPNQPAAYSAVLNACERAGRVEEGREFVKSIMQRHPKAKAPRFALDSFDLARAKKKLQELNSQPTPVPAPTAAPTELPPVPVEKPVVPEQPVDAPVAPAPATSNEPEAKP